MSKCLICGKELQGYQKKVCSVSCENIYRGRLIREKYYESPSTCACCGKVLSFEQRKNKYCSSSCAAKITNIGRKVTEEHKSLVRDSLNNYYKENHIFSNNSRSLNALRKCIVCGKDFRKSENVGSTNLCCSKDCRKYYLEHKRDFMSEKSRMKLSECGRKSVDVQGSIRRSKNEMYFYELCKNKFKNVFHNKRIFNGWDADVIIDDIKCAVFWNGIWHYKEIGKGYPLELVQKRDEKKIEEIRKYGYEVYIIKDLGKANKKFVEKEFNKFLEIHCGL